MLPTLCSKRSWHWGDRKQRSVTFPTKGTCQPALLFVWLLLFHFVFRVVLCASAIFCQRRVTPAYFIYFPFPSFQFTCFRRYMWLERAFYIYLLMFFFSNSSACWTVVNSELDEWTRGPCKHCFCLPGVLKLNRPNLHRQPLWNGTNRRPPRVQCTLIFYSRRTVSLGRLWWLELYDKFLLEFYADYEVERSGLYSGRWVHYGDAWKCAAAATCVQDVRSCSVTAGVLVFRL